uniref:Transmembrane protein n=1 Tax=Glossina palpalis gambiensis TaxID=67801 RepID=A0A1B0BQY5_9MUSC
MLLSLLVSLSRKTEKNGASYITGPERINILNRQQFCNATQNQHNTIRCGMGLRPSTKWQQSAMQDPLLILHNVTALGTNVGLVMDCDCDHFVTYMLEIIVVVLVNASNFPFLIAVLIVAIVIGVDIIWFVD